MSRYRRRGSTETLSVEAEELEQTDVLLRGFIFGIPTPKHVAQAPSDREEQTDLIPLAEE